jgi:Domain of unknown function (DUF3806)
MKQRIEPLTQGELDWIAAQREAATQLVQTFSSADAPEALTPAALDRTFAAWLASSPSNVDLINQTINAVGVAFGQLLVDGIGLQWVIATDAHGSDLAVHGLPGEGDILIYPANFVAKRWERRETHFLEGAYASMAQDIAALAERRRKPWWKLR